MLIVCVYLVVYIDAFQLLRKIALLQCNNISLNVLFNIYYFWCSIKFCFVRLHCIYCLSSHVVKFLIILTLFPYHENICTWKSSNNISHLVLFCAHSFFNNIQCFLYDTPLYCYHVYIKFSFTFCW